jgi:hypothetical protein
MRSSSHGGACFALALTLVTGCTVSGQSMPGSDSGTSAAPFVCARVGDRGCSGNIAFTCVADASGLPRARPTACGISDAVCIDGECRACVADTLGCSGNDVARCASDGTRWEVQQACDTAGGMGCVGGRCVDLCESAGAARSYIGCTFYPVDLDTYAIASEDASFGVVISNPNPFTTTATLEVDDSVPGTPASVREVARVDVPPFAIEVFVPEGRRRVDGHTSGDAWAETHSALSRRSYRLRSTHPIVAYQFNPLDGSESRSSDASLLLPATALGDETTVIGWPQTLTQSGAPDERSGIDARATLTIVGSEADTDVTVVLGARVVRVLGVEPGTAHGSGERLTFRLQPFDTLNLETDALGADFSGTLVQSSAPVVVYTGSEAADVPAFDRVSDRLCCADHVEGQLAPDDTLGSRFALARTPARSALIAEAAADASEATAVTNEIEFVRVLAVAPGQTSILTGLPTPFDRFTLSQGEVATLVLDRDTTLWASAPVSVIQLLASQQAAGLPDRVPGGDPALIVVPPIEQWRDDYVFLTPATYAFDSLTMVVDRGTLVLLDGEPLPSWCARSALEGSDPRLDLEVIRCALSLPTLRDGLVLAGEQRDGEHRVVADRPFGAIVSGFDRYVSYAYAAGMNVSPLL